MGADGTEAAIRAVLEQHARLPVDPASLGPDDDLFQAGMTSHASVNVMLALEDEFDIEFPDTMITRSVFASIGAIAEHVAQLRPELAA